MPNMHKREGDYQKLFDTVPLPYQSLDATGNFLNVNQAWLDLFGCKKHEVIGRFFGDYMCESSRNMLGVTFENFKREGFVSSPVFEARRQDTGEMILVTVNGQVEHDEYGQFICTHCLLNDVSARAKAEAEILALNAKLQESESQYRRIAATIPAMLYDCALYPDGSSRFLYVGPRCRDILELDESELLADSGTFWRLLHAEDFAQFNWQDATFNREGETFTAEVRITTRSGKSKWIQLSSHPNSSRPGEPMIRTGFILDITERKATEVQLNLYREQIDSSIELLRHVTANLPGMVYQYRLRPDGSSCFPYTSEGIRDIYQITPEEARYEASKVFDRLHPEDRAKVVASIQVSACTGLPWRQRYRVRLPDGAEHWLQGSAMPQCEDNGDCLWHGFITDVSNEVAAEESLRLAASVFANSQEGVIITDAGGFLTDVNPAFTRITGYAREDVLGRTPKILSSGRHDAEFFARMWQALGETGAWRGEVWNRNKAGEVYPELLSITAVKDAAGQISHYIGSFSDISNIKEREAQLDRIAHYDPLTGLPNRRLLSDRLSQAIAQARRSGKIMAVCVLDLDNFKPINDRLGHAAGDEVLIAIAQRLSSCMREGDTVARQGGDEFVLLLQNLLWVEECDAIFSRILKEISVPVIYNGHAVTVSASIGITLFPQDRVEADQLLRHADQAMYLAKQSGRNNYCLFNAEHDRLVRDHRRFIEDIAEALDNDQFILYYQPQVDMAYGRVVGAEALIRWRHPERGLLLPAEFLYVVEGSALEIPLGEWVLDNALKQLAAWQAEGMQISISVNLTFGHVLQPNFEDRLAEILARYPSVSTRNLEIELLESSALAALKSASSLIKSCQSLGIRVALDDFGTGFASLAYFKYLPVDTLKIDQTLVHDMHINPENNAIVEGVIRIAEAFGRQVIAEGVESIEQGAMLVYLGCRRAQGFAIARPMPAESLPQWVAEWPGQPSWKGILGTQLAREDMTLVIAESIHRQWGSQLISYIGANLGDPPGVNSRECRFGLWIEAHGRVRYSHLDEFKHLDALHAQLHDLADQLLTQHAQDPQGAGARIDEVKQLQDRVTSAINELMMALLSADTEAALVDGARYTRPAC